MRSSESSSESTKSSKPNAFKAFSSYAISKSSILLIFLTLVAKDSLFTSIPLFSRASVISVKSLILLTALLLAFKRLLYFITLILPLTFLTAAAKSLELIPSSSELSYPSSFKASILRISSSSFSKASNFLTISAS
jgi:hypothetical protein